MTKNDFNKYKKIAAKIINLLIAEQHSSLYDIKILYHILVGNPYCLDTEGHYTYQGKYYDSLKELPRDVIEQLLK